MKIKYRAFAYLALSIFCVVGASAYAQSQEEGRRFQRLSKLKSQDKANENGANGTININGTMRTYILRAPEIVRPRREKLPLVIALHGGGGNAQNAERMMGWTQKARQEGFIVVYPNGSGPRGNMFLTFNGKHCCSYAMENNIDDVAFISALIDKLVAQNNVDPRRIYVTGMSNGAIMSHRLGAELSNKITAIAPVVGTVFGDEKIPTSKVSALIINGALDKNVPPEGGFSQGRSRPNWGALPMKPAVEQGAFWARANNCSNPRSSINGQVQTMIYECPRGSAVKQIMVLDNGHAWPNGQKGSPRGDEPSKSYDATSEIWNFFKDKSK